MLIFATAMVRTSHHDTYNTYVRLRELMNLPPYLPPAHTTQALTSVEIIKEAIERLIEGFTGATPIPRLDWTVNVRTCVRYPVDDLYPHSLYTPSRYTHEACNNCPHAHLPTSRVQQAVLVYTIAGKLGMGVFCRGVARRTGSSTVRAYGIGACALTCIHICVK